MEFASSRLLILCLLIPQCALSQTHPVRINDSSDWWSWIRQEENPNQAELTGQKKALPDSHFQIAGVTIGSFTESAKLQDEFGRTTEVQRGDGASGRHQFCYAAPAENLHLILEYGELDAVVYLFADGPAWNGEAVCRPAPRIASLSTKSGLKLGISRKQVETILGSPSQSSPDKLIYLFEFQSKTSPRDLAKLRKENPSMSDKEFRQNFDLIDVSAYIEARFKADHLNYLAISRSESY